MRRTQVTDCRVIPFETSAVYRGLTDFARYPDWWPPELRLQVLNVTNELVGSRFRIHPRGGCFVCEVTRVICNQELHLRYIDGLHRGVGIWTLKSSDQGTQLCYQVDLEPLGFLTQLLSHILDFAAFHSRAMNGVFEGLEQWLSRRSAGE